MDDIRKIYAEHGMKTTPHAELRMKERNISFYEVREALLHGEIIDARYDEYPRPRYLILKFSGPDMPLHIVAGIDWRTIEIVTAYRPLPEKWDSTFRYRR